MKKITLTTVLVLFINCFYAQNTSFKENATPINGDLNVAFGVGSGESLAEGKGNSFFGFRAGISSDGNGNVFIGIDSGANNRRGSGNVFIGSRSGAELGDVDGLLYIESTESNSPLIWGSFVDDIVNINGRFGINNQGPTSAFNLGNTTVRDDNFIVFGKRVATELSELPFIGQDSYDHKANDLGIGTSKGGSINFYTDIETGSFSPEGMKMRITPNGNVGIGTAEPSEKLDVNGNMQLQGYSAANDGPLGALKFFNRYESSQSVLAQIQARRGVGSHQKGDLAFYTKDGVTLSEVMRATSDGKVGIGTSTPNYDLDVNGDFRANTNASGERLIAMEAPAAGNHRGSGTQNARGLVYRVLSNPAAGDPIFQIRSSGQAVRFFAEHDGWTGAKDNSAWFGGTRDNYFKGNVGIGTATPVDKLEVDGNVRSSSKFVITGIGAVQKEDSNDMRLWSTNRLIFGTGGANNRMQINTNGNVGIGTTSIPIDYKLAVAGKIISEEVKVKLQSDGWPDYVFANNYNLMPLNQLEAFIDKNSHLPNIPNAKDVESNGLLLGEMNAKLLEKIEELTLYTIEQQKELEKQKAINKALEERLSKLEQLINK